VLSLAPSSTRFGESGPGQAAGQLDEDVEQQEYVDQPDHAEVDERIRKPTALRS
jgi:hypothetical protein